MTDLEAFPHPVYADAVLEPLFHGVQRHYAGHMDAVDRAHLVMLRETGILRPEDAAAIARALAEIAEVPREGLTYTGEHEDWFFWVQHALRWRLGDLGGALHTARSRNDIDHTVFKMALRARTHHLLGRLLNLSDALTGHARAEHATLIVAYTHGQPAQPSTLGHYLGSVIEVLGRDLARLDAAADLLELCPMGAAAITTTGFPVDRDRMAELLGFEAPLLNSYGCIASVDYVTGLYSALRLVMIHLGRVVQDLAQWSSFEVGQIRVPGSLVQVSSIMPQKRNPVPVEHMRHLASAAAGHCDTVVWTMHNTPHADMNDSEGEVQAAGYRAIEAAVRVVDLMAAFVPACSVDGARVRRTLDAACATVTELADTLVRDEGLAFRAAHDVAARTARAVIAREASLAEGHDDFARAFEAVAGRPTRLDEGAFAEAVSPEGFVARRDRPGGPAPSALLPALDGYARHATTLAAARDARRARWEDADRGLTAAFAALTED